MDLSEISSVSLPLTLERLAINQATTRTRWSHVQSLEGYARNGITQVALWRDKVDEIGVSATKSLLADLNLSVTCLNRIGPVFGGDGLPDVGFADDTRRTIDDAFELGAESVMFFPGTSLPANKDITGARTHMEASLFEALEIARQAGVRLVLEPLHPMIAGDRSCLNTLKHCNDLCDQTSTGNLDLGIVVDVYHVWWDPELANEIRRAGADRLAGFHINDWLVPTTDLLRDRGMIGDGVIELRKIRGWMEQAGYTGAVEIEIFSDHWWHQDPDEVVRLAIERAIAQA